MQCHCIMHECVSFLIKPADQALPGGQCKNTAKYMRSRLELGLGSTTCSGCLKRLQLDIWVISQGHFAGYHHTVA